MENIDELMRVKFESDNPADRFEFREEYWEQAQALLEAEEARRRKRRRWLLWWCFFAVALIGAGVCFWAIPRKNNTISEGVPTQQIIDNKSNNSSNNPTPIAAPTNAATPTNGGIATNGTTDNNASATPVNNGVTDSGSTNEVNDATTINSRTATNGSTNNTGGGNNSTRGSNTPNKLDRKAAGTPNTAARKSAPNTNGRNKLVDRTQETSNKGSGLATQTQQSASLSEVTNRLDAESQNQSTENTINPVKTNQFNIGSQSESENKTSVTVGDQASKITIPNLLGIGSDIVAPPTLAQMAAIEPLSVAIPLPLIYEKQTLKISARYDLPKIIEPVNTNKPFTHSLYLNGTYHTPADSANWGGAVGYEFGWKFRPALSIRTGLSMRYLQGSWALDSISPETLDATTTNLDYSFGYNSTVSTREQQGILLLEVPLGLHWHHRDLGLAGGVSYARLIRSRSVVTETTDGSFLNQQTTRQAGVFSSDNSIFNTNSFGAYLGFDWQITPRIALAGTVTRRSKTPAKTTSGSPDIINKNTANYWFDLGIKFNIRS